MVYILSTLPLYAGVLLKFRIPLCPHCLCLCNKQYEKYGKQRHEKILEKLKTHTKYLKLGDCTKKLNLEGIRGHLLTMWTSTGM